MDQRFRHIQEKKNIKFHIVFDVHLSSSENCSRMWVGLQTEWGGPSEMLTVEGAGFLVTEYTEDSSPKPRRNRR